MSNGVETSPVGDADVEAWVDGLRNNPHKLTEPTAINITEEHSLAFRRGIEEQVQQLGATLAGGETQVVTVDPAEAA